MTAGAGCLPGWGRARGHGRSRPLRACRLGAGEALRRIPLFGAGQMYATARLPQRELAEATKLSPRSARCLGRGISRTARKETSLLLADALGLAGPVRVGFVAAARGNAPAAGVQAATLGVPSLAR